MQKKIKKILLLMIGIFFVILGFIGLVLPFLQGILFLFIGFLLISMCFPKIRLWMNRHTERYPHLHSALRKTEIWIINFIGEV